MPATMPSAATAAIAAVTFAALYAGHQVGDHVVQSDRAAIAKGVPDRERLAAGVSPWTGWGACLRHVAGYTATQAAALVLVGLVAPLELTGMVIALIVSASTHAVIDRRWIVRRLIRLKGCHDWREGPYLIDQSLHVGAMLVAAVLGVAVPGAVGVVTVAIAAAALVGAALMTERRLGHGLSMSTVTPDDTR
ncbi:Protein of unknown function [Nonomuraea solani]|uniref:DUF3307 domain-containing protein n=1 Tax=Nonomuraea solani TaxID=1144553 RepID=A0A1H6DWU3_9ACTN|nr:DUF3307 domain-containing protein [Nonomuraea solani]SEG89055.1 Protein of unknown function [Nonomuraea solani]